MNAPSHQHARPTNALVTDLFQRNLKWTIRAAQTASQEGPARDVSLGAAHRGTCLSTLLESDRGPLTLSIRLQKRVVAPKHQPSRGNLIMRTASNAHPRAHLLPERSPSHGPRQRRARSEATHPPMTSDPSENSTTLVVTAKRSSPVARRSHVADRSIRPVEQYRTVGKAEPHHPGPAEAEQAAGYGRVRTGTAGVVSDRGLLSVQFDFDSRIAVRRSLNDRRSKMEPRRCCGSA